MGFDFSKFQDLDFSLILWNGLLDLILVFSLGSLVFLLPGLWVMAGALLVAASFPEIFGFSWELFSLCLGLVIFAELIEFFSGLWGVKRGGGSALSGVMAIVGGIAGALLGSVLIPLPVLGTFAGLIAGTFIGVWVIEYSKTRSEAKAHKVAIWALVGRLIGFFVKFAVGGMVLILVLENQWEFFSE